MNVMRFVGRTSREAMRLLRDALGPDALVLANRPCAEGVELLAAAPDALGTLPVVAGSGVGADRSAPARGGRESMPASARERVRRVAPRDELVAPKTARVPEPDADAMSTVSFQDYVRQRLRERSRVAAAQPGQPAHREAAPVAAAQRPVRNPAPAGAAMPLTPSEGLGRRVSEPASTPSGSSEPRTVGAEPAPWDHSLADGPAAGFSRAARAAARAAVQARGAAGSTDDAARIARQAGAAAGPAVVSEALVAELQSLKGAISRQFANLGWFEGVVRSPLQGRLLRAMIAGGFSLKLARSVVARLPADYGERAALMWLERVLARNLRCATPADAFESGGVFALVGPTGVGKTTTTAKIAARHVLQHGPRSVALITVDTYRLGAHDQLRAFGRILGVPVHVAHDASTLHDLLRLRATRRLVLVDTVGMGHRDARIRGLLASLPDGEVRRVVVASCASQAESIDESLRAYEASAADGVVLTKLDEAARLGGALDCLLRQRLRLLGVCDGQRVPEDWHAADPARLVGRALSAAPAGAFALDQEDLPLVFGVAASGHGDVAHA